MYTISGLLVLLLTSPLAGGGVRHERQEHFTFPAIWYVYAFTNRVTTICLIHISSLDPTWFLSLQPGYKFTGLFLQKSQHSPSSCPPGSYLLPSFMSSPWCPIPPPVYTLSHPQDFAEESLAVRKSGPLSFLSLKASNNLLLQCDMFYHLENRRKFIFTEKKKFSVPWTLCPPHPVCEYAQYHCFYINALKYLDSISTLLGIFDRLKMVWKCKHWWG